jgi:thiol-disulfide isomerase/thioredoxin
MKFPAFSAKKLGEKTAVDFNHKEGEAVVLVFLASWCLPCQSLIDEIQKIEKRYESSYTKFYYVFSHDTVDDAKGFIQTYKVTGNLLEANQILLDTFHQPELPSIYVGDRFGWLVSRYNDTDEADLKALDELLKYHTSL